jgi:hypothetical protein
MDERSMEEEGNDREGQGWGIEENCYFNLFWNCKFFFFFLDKTVHRNPLKPVGQNKVYTYFN